MTGTLLFLITAIFNPAMAIGPDAASLNPAQLAYPERQGFGCRILDVSAALGNNSFSLSQYNRYTGAFLDEAAKQDIVGSVPRTGMGVHFAAQASAAEFGYGTLAVSVRTVGSADVTLPHDAFELALYGNELNRVYNADDLRGRALVFMRAGASAGSAIGRNVTAGIGFHYLRGLFYGELTDCGASFITTPEAFASDGRVAYRTATGGSGWSVDAGLAYLRNNWRLSLACLDISPGITWTDGVSEGVYAYRLDSSNAYEVSRGGRFKQTFDRGVGATFTTAVPLVVNAGAGWRVFEWLNCGALLQGKLLSRATTGNWSATTYGEAWPLEWLPVGVEAGVRDGTGAVLGLNAGLIWHAFAFVLGARDESGLLLGAKGLAYHVGINWGAFHNERDVVHPDVLHVRYEGS